MLNDDLCSVFCVRTEIDVNISTTAKTTERTAVIAIYYCFYCEYWVCVCKRGRLNVCVKRGQHDDTTAAATGEFVSEKFSECYLV